MNKRSLCDRDHIVLCSCSIKWSPAATVNPLPRHRCGATIKYTIKYTQEYAIVLSAILAVSLRCHIGMTFHTIEVYPRITIYSLQLMRKCTQRRKARRVSLSRLFNLIRNVAPRRGTARTAIIILIIILIIVMSMSLITIFIFSRARNVIG